MHGNLTGSKGLAGIADRQVQHVAATEKLLHGIESSQTFWAIEVDLAVLHDRRALAPEQSLVEPVAGNIPAPEQRVLVAGFAELAAILNHIVPSLGKLGDPGFGKGIHVVVADRQGHRERQAIDLAIEGSEIEHGLVVAILFEVGLIGDEWLKRLGNALLDHERLTIQALEADVGKRVGDSFA